MGYFREQIDEINGLLLSDDKARAYSNLLQLQEISTADSSAVEALAGSSSTIISSLVADISYNDEEMYVPFRTLIVRTTLCLIFLY